MEIEKAYLTIHPMTRSKEPLLAVKRIILFNSKLGDSARQRRNKIERLAITEEDYYSAHYVIGQEGSILQCIPEEEVSWITPLYEIDRTSIGIDLCMNEKKELPKEAKKALLLLLNELVERYELDRKTQVVRYYDILGSREPYPLVENSMLWQQIQEN